MNRPFASLAILVSLLPPVPGLLAHELLWAGFQSPPREHRPETWFHLIGGNVSKPGLSKDLAAISQAGMQGIQLFHGSGRPWPGVSPQIQTLSESWDDMIRHVADETKRLDLRFTMQNCPGWAMSGGPWITPDKAMRHVISSAQSVQGGQASTFTLARPEPCREDWRDYRDIAVLAFPTPDGESGTALQPAKVRSSLKGAKWNELLAGKENASVVVPPAEEAHWLELSFEQPVTLRSIELPPIEMLMKRRNFDPDTRILVQIPAGSSWKTLTSNTVPRGTWQDRQPEFPYVLAVADASSKTYRITFENKHPLEISQLKLSSTARPHDWRGQAGFALRSMERSDTPTQNSAAWVGRESVLDLTKQVTPAGRLQWDVPPGNWTIVRFGHVNTGAKNKPAPPEATGFECDKLSAAGAEQHFAGYIGRLTKEGGAADGGRLQGMLIDSWECYTQTWTPEMEREFEARRGYPLRKWMPALAGWVVDDHLSTGKFLRDWRATVSDLLVGQYFGRLAELARSRDMKLSFETAIGDVSPGDILEYQGKADIPMCEFWYPNDPHWGGYETKPVRPTVSAAHLYGKPRIAAEAFTNLDHDWSDHPFSYKHMADRNFALGINHLVFHTYTHNPLDLVPGTSFGGKIGSPFIRGQTWWQHMPLFTGYLARCQHLLQQGRPVADVLCYLGDDYNHRPRQDAPFPDGYAFDYLNQHVLLHRLEAADGKLRVPEGTTWQVLWLPDEPCRRLTPETLARLKQLLEAGATVIGGAPRENPSLVNGADADRRFAALVKELWNGEPSGDRRIGKGRLIWGADLGPTLAALGIEPDVGGLRPLAWNHRRDGSTDIYFVTADRTTALDATVDFRAAGAAELWDPLHTTRTPATVFRAENGRTRIPIRLPAAGSVFVIFRPGASTPGFVRVAHDGQVLIDASDAARRDTAPPYPQLGLRKGQAAQPWVEPAAPRFELLDHGSRLLAFENGTWQLTRADRTVATVESRRTGTVALDQPWSLSFPKQWVKRSECQLAGPTPWSSLDEPDARSFSGTATYRTGFETPALDENQRAILDLGRVESIAEILVNGQPAATLWAPPFRTDITRLLKPGTNRLEIKVTNTWHNRLAYDASLPARQRKTWTLNGPPPDSPPKPAGLLGPALLRIAHLTNIPPQSP